MRYLYFDLETTGFSRSSDILEFGGVLCDEQCNITKLINEYFHYYDSIPYSAVNVHGLTNQKLEFLGKRDFLAAAEDILKLVDNPDICLCGHNIISYDIPVLESNLKRAGYSWNTKNLKVIDTLAISKQKYIGSHKLEDVLNKCLTRTNCSVDYINSEFVKLLRDSPDVSVDTDKTFHSALYDSYACWCAHQVLSVWD